MGGYYHLSYQVVQTVGEAEGAEAGVLFATMPTV